MALQVSYESGNDFVGRRASAGVNIYPAQTFIPDNTFTITSVSLLLGRISGYSGTCSIGFYTTDGNGHPDVFRGSISFGGSTLTADTWGLWDYESSDATSITSSDLQSNYPNDNELNGLTLLIPDSSYYYSLALITEYIGATGQAIFAGGLDTGNSPQTGTNEFRITDSGSLATGWKTVSKGGITFTAGVKYAIIFSGGAASNTSFPYWALDSGGGYGDGIQLKSLDGTSTWLDLSGDFLFRIYGDAATPTKPTNPTPENNDTGVDFSGLVLDWDDGGGADTFDVYIGPLGSLVKIADAIVPSTYTVDIGDAPTEQVIYWRVDATNAGGTTTGDTWNFDARPVKAKTPTPTDTDTDVDFSDLTLSWGDGGNADTYDVYVGDAADNLTKISSTQADVSIVLNDTQRALFTATVWWRIDAINVYGTTTGDDWSFTIAAPGKAQTPTPANDAGNIKITGTKKLKKLQWEAPD